MLLLQIFSWFWQWKNSENRLIFDEVKAYKNGANFWATLFVPNNLSTVEECRYYLNIALPSELFRKRTDKFLCKLIAHRGYRDLFS